MRRILLFLLCLFLAFPGWAQSPSGVRIRLTLPGATNAETTRFHQLVAPELPQALLQLPPNERASVRAIAQKDLPDGIEIRLSVAAPPPEAEKIARDFAKPLTDVAVNLRPGRLQINSYHLEISLPASGTPWTGLTLFILLALAAFLILALWLKERSRGALGLPSLQGIPLLGTLPKETQDLKSDPCLALGAMFLMSIQQAKRGEIAVVCPSGNSLPIACIGQALVKAGHRVLVVDRFGEKSDLLELFREGSGSGEKKVMDILTIKQEKGSVPVPTTLRENYDWVLHFVPRFLSGKKTVLVLDSGPLEWRLFRNRVLAAISRSPLVGVVLLGLRPPSHTLSRYQLRSHFERLRRLDQNED